MNAPVGFPYQDIIDELVASTMRAQAIIVSAYLEGKPASNFHVEINKQFSWLTKKFPRGGTNRHFFDEPDTSIQTLRTGGAQSTRISRLIVAAFEEDTRSQSKLAKGNNAFSIRSPLAVVYDFLTIPNNSGSRAYALLALRNFLFSKLAIVPQRGGNENGLSATDIDHELSTIWTSLRERYFSKGLDKLPVGSLIKNPSTAVVRHFLAMKGVLRFYFRKDRECLAYLQSGILVRRGDKEEPYPFEIERAPRLERLPEVGEVVNELCGLPLPIRGADTIFRGGLKFSSCGGLVMAIHGGPGCGKTSLALSFGAYLAPMGIQTLFIGGEEDTDDLSARLANLVPEDFQRLDFFGESNHEAFTFERLPRDGDGGSDIDFINNALLEVKEALATQSQDNSDFHIPKPCRAIIVLDGLHDYLADKTRHSAGSEMTMVEKLYKLIESAKVPGALVILTTGETSREHIMLDYLVDVAIHLGQESMSQYGTKPDRRFRLMKARHQLCAVGTHGLQIAGSKGVRFSPQINYQLDRRSIWKVGIPDKDIYKNVLRKTAVISANDNGKRAGKVQEKLGNSSHAPEIFCGSNVFINGEGSGGKAALALKIAMAPSFSKTDNQVVDRDEKILVVSFLYPKEYYAELRNKLIRVRDREYGANVKKEWKTRIEVIRLYPGHLKPNDLYNRIEWELESAELYGDPYTCVVIDGIHNVYLQFPEIENYTLFWPQIYNSLRSRSVMTITTHTTLSLRRAIEGGSFTPSPPIDNNRSEPLRHALVQKTDFQFEIDPVPVNKYPNNEYLSSLFAIRTMSAIGQPIPKGHILWDRESFLLMEAPPQEKQEVAQPPCPYLGAN
jgi:KaiC/GvpD/RAD55 family RecA-like ATPase